MQYKTRAFVIRRKNLREADRLVILLTEKKGKIKAVAKSVKKSSSHLAGHLEQFCFSQMQIVETRDLPIIASATTIRSFPFLRQDLQKTHLAYYFAEILDQFLAENEEQKSIFVLAWQVFNFLDQSAGRRKINDYLISFFIFNLLAVLGFAPELKTCAVDGEKLDAKNLFWSDGRGGVVCGKCAHKGNIKISKEAVKILRLLINHNIRILNSLPKNKELAGLVEKIAKNFLRYHLQKELKSERFLT